MGSATTGPDTRAMIPDADVAEPVADRVRVRRAAGLAAGATALFAALVGLKAGGDTAARWVGDTGTFAAALVACLFCIGAARRHAGDLSRLWWLLAAACGAWAAGELIWGWTS